jgi:hypothetical protein
MVTNRQAFIGRFFPLLHRSCKLQFPRQGATRRITCRLVWKIKLQGLEFKFMQHVLSFAQHRRVAGRSTRPGATNISFHYADNVKGLPTFYPFIFFLHLALAGINAKLFLCNRNE